MANLQSLENYFYSLVSVILLHTLDGAVASVAAGRGAGGICPRTQAEVGAEGDVVIFCDKNILKFCELCWGRAGHGRQIMCRTMHILDVISSVSRSSKCTIIIGSCVDSTGKLTALPRPLAGFKGPTS